MNEKINLTRPDGTQVSGDIICFIENKDNKKRYVYYTLNEIVGADASSTVKIYISKIKQDDPTLDAVISDEDWNVLKGYMGDALKDTTNPNVSYLPLTELNNPVSVSEKAIAMPTSYDYINKQRGIYAQSVATTAAPAATDTAVPVVEPAPTEEVPKAAVEPVIPVATEPVISPEPAVEEPIVPATDAAIPTEPTNVEPATEPVIEPVIPVVTEPVVAEPIAVEEPTVAEPTVVPEPIAVEEPVVSEPVIQPEQPAIEPTVATEAVNVSPIDVSEIEKKYADMIDSINKLKEQEIEAVKRYNATIELSSMHNEQHANYVQNEQNKEAVADVQPAPIEAAPIDIPLEPVQMPEQEAAVASTSPTAEPVPVSPVVPEAAPSTASDVETNWFDMPENN